MNESMQATIGVNLQPFIDGLRNGYNKANRWAQKMADDVKEKLSGAFGAAAITAAIGTLAKESLSLADSVGNMSEALGVSTDFLQGLGYAASQAGASVEDAQKLIEKFSIKIGEARQGNDEAIKTFRDLGVSLVDNNGKAKTTEALFFDVAGALQDIQDETVRSAKEFEIFGKVGPKVAAMLSQSMEDLKNQIKEAPKLTEEEIALLKEAGDQMDAAHKRSIILAGGFIGHWAKIRQEAIATGIAWKQVFNIDLEPEEKAFIKLQAMRVAAENAKKSAQPKQPGQMLGKQEMEEIVKSGKVAAEIFERINASERSAAENLKRAQAEQLRLADEYEKAAGDQVKQAQIQLQLANAAKDANDARLTLEKQITDQKKLQNSIAIAERELANKRFGKLGPQTVEDVANMDLRRKDQSVRDFYANQKAIAQKVIEAQQKSKEMAERGFIGGRGGARAWEAEAQRLTEQLKVLPEEVRNPFRMEMERIKEMKDQSDSLKKLIEQNDSGIKVVPVNPPSQGAQ